MERGQSIWVHVLLSACVVVCVHLGKMAHELGNAIFGQASQETGFLGWAPSYHRETQEQWWWRSPLVAAAHFCACWSFPRGHFIHIRKSLAPVVSWLHFFSLLYFHVVPFFLSVCSTTFDFIVCPRQCLHAHPLNSKQWQISLKLFLVKSFVLYPNIFILSD